MRKLNLISWGLLLPLMLQAAPITEHAARQRAQAFLQGKQIMHKSMKVSRAAQRKVASNALYIFNVEDDGGFVIVSGDDATEPILGYTTQGRYDEDRMPANFRFWLQQRTAEVEALQRVEPTSSAAGGSVPGAFPLLSAAKHARIDPLIVTTWDQGSAVNDLNSDGVYNVHLPMIDGKYPCTGCVATAGAQLMYYYHWPQTQVPSLPGYEAETQANTSQALPPITFQWDKMKTSYAYQDPSAEAVSAVADLMLYCGYAAKMEYDINSSGSNIATLASAMVAYFGYSPTWTQAYREEYSISDWDEKIYNELANNRPVIYGGRFNGGHAFICDGYDGDGMYHFNWGWGGDFNGYFKLQATNPYGRSDITDMGFIDQCYGIFGLQPTSWPAIVDVNAPDTWSTPTIEGTVATAGVKSVEGTIAKLSFYNNNAEDCNFGFGLGLLGTDGTVTPFDTRWEGYMEYTLSSGWGASVNYNYTWGDLADGTYSLVPISLLSGEETWRRCKPADLWLELTVHDGQRELVVHPIVQLKVNAFELVSGGTLGNSQTVRINVTNMGDNVEKNLYVHVGTAEDKGKFSNFKAVKIAADNTKDYRINVGTLDEGTHTLWLTSDYDGTEVLAKTNVTISQGLVVTDFAVVGKPYVNKVLQVDATVVNQAGDYTEPLYLFASPTTTKSFVYAAGTAVPKDGSETVTFYFQPQEAATWNLWVTTDQAGTNVIGQTTVEVGESPETNLDIAQQVLNAKQRVVTGEKMFVCAEITNQGATTYDDVIVVDLYKYNPETSIGTSVQTLRQEVKLEPSANKPVNFVFKDLEDGAQYFCGMRYYSKGSLVSVSGGKLYTFVYAPITIGDANGDGKVSITDAVSVVNYVLRQPGADFSFEPADVNGDDYVTITDAVQIVNMILTQQSQQAVKARQVLDPQ